MAITLENLLKLVAQIQADPQGDHRLETLAKQVGLTGSHLQRIFAKAIGESPARIAQRIALERAAAQLVTSTISVLDVALNSGFDSHEGFTRAFRRYFDMSPKAYRHRGLKGATDQAELLHRNVVQHVGPCIGLYHATNAPVSKRRTPNVDYTVNKKTLNATPILFMRRRIEPDKIASTLAELLPGVFQYATKAGIAFAGHPFCRYRDWGPTGVTLEAGLPSAEKNDGAEDVLAGELPQGPAVTTIHTGPYDTLKTAYEALEKHIADKALKATSDPWEVYLTDPGTEPDPAKWQTEVIWPVNE